ncbi:hypothetical protein MLD38_021467 [Melastoma candidum]|uniref:Uncharacterized protein n=1 Tax=Melastoma candidum TaxID=119954 RepID=A0ACB9QG65_9MYRT|nr:hypothetical protein MLD38_021467 [Melastoma candidum]
MGKKRKSGAAARLDEVDRSLYTSFCTAANSLSHLYTQSMNHQRLSFQAGERHSLEKLYHWMLRQQEEGARVSTMDIVSYLQNELEAGLGDVSMSPRVPAHHQHSQTAMHSLGPGVLVCPGQFGEAAPSQGLRPVKTDQHRGKDAVFSDALSSPVRRSLQHYQLTQGGGDHANSNTNIVPSVSGNLRNNEGMIPHNTTREANSTSSNDATMDMNADGPFTNSLY